MRLGACKACGAGVAVQTRGKMGPGDYYVDRIDDPPMYPHGPYRNTETGASLRNYHALVEVHDGNRDDIRIACTQCDRHSRWLKDAGQLLGELESWS
jgi:hypothetical protein